MYRLIILAPLVALILLVVLLGSIERAPVSRTRLTAFARRHRLVVTVENGDRVIRYLATTRRWRTIGLAAGLAVSMGWALAHGGLRVDSLTLFAGWFVGALIAEVRLARTSFGPRRAASLAPRVPVMYLPRGAWLLLPGAAAISTAIAIAEAAVAVRARGVDPVALAWWLAAMAVAVAVYLIQLRVLRRPQPAAAPDVVAADDAIRSRSLHVLAGGGTSLVLYCAFGQLARLNPGGFGLVAQAIGLASFVAIVAVPLIGWSVATAQWPITARGGAS